MELFWMLQMQNYPSGEKHLKMWVVLLFWVPWASSLKKTSVNYFSNDWRTEEEAIGDLKSVYLMYTYVDKSNRLPYWGQSNL
jgi:hypothetical protein